MFLNGYQKSEKALPPNSAYTAKKLIGYLYRITASYDTYVPNEDY